MSRNFRNYWIVWIFFNFFLDFWFCNYNSDNWEPGFMTIIVIWQSIVTVDSICNSCDVFTTGRWPKEECWPGKDSFCSCGEKVQINCGFISIDFVGSKGSPRRKKMLFKQLVPGQWGPGPDTGSRTVEPRGQTVQGPIYLGPFCHLYKWRLNKAKVCTDLLFNCFRLKDGHDKKALETYNRWTRWL